MTDIKNTIVTAWDSLLGRVLILGLSAGWVPYWLMSLAVAHIPTNA